MILKIIFAIFLAMLGDVYGVNVNPDKNQTSFSTDGGCRFFVEDIYFTRTEASSAGKKVQTKTVIVTGDHFLSNQSGTDPCGNYSGWIKLDFAGIQYSEKDGGGPALQNFSVTFEIEHVQKYRWWEVKSLAVEAIGDMTKDVTGGELIANWTGAVMQSVAMGASEKFSYACSKPNVLMYSEGRETQPTFKLQFKNLHLQPFLYKQHGNFTDNVDDCVAFFSASVWMALGTLLLFVLIILSGVVMLSNMVTVNRFDDPKAPQLVILAKE